jgi:hypothetical protein
VYIVAPGMPAASVSTAAATQEVEMLRNDRELQAVRNRSLGLTGAVWYRPGRLQIGGDLEIAVDQACLMLFREAPREFAVTLANPRNERLRVAVTITAGARTLGGTIELPDGMDAGKSVTTVFVAESND